MSNIYSDISNALAASEYPVYLESSAPASDLPDTYLTYMVISDSPLFHAKNEPVGMAARVMVKLYSRDPEITQGGRGLLDNLMDGYLRIGGGDLPFYAPTGHYGYTCDYRYFDYEED